MRNFVFGVEDSLVSTVGLLSGIAIASVPRQTIILTGVVLIFVEAFSMGVGSFLSEHSAEEYMHQYKGSAKRSAIGAGVMFLSYMLAGLVPLTPYIIFDYSIALRWSIIFSLCALLLLGIISGEIFKIHAIKNGIVMLVLGGVAIAVGILVGELMKGYR